MAGAVIEMRVEHARPFAELDFGGRTAVTWLDTGGGPLVLCSDVVADLGLVPYERDYGEEGKHQVLTPPTVAVGGHHLDVADAHLTSNAEPLMTEGFPAEAFLPAHVMARHQVVFDYPGRRFEVDTGDAPRGVGVPTSSRPRPGWPAVELEVSGQPVSLLLDTGAACCMLSEVALAALGDVVERRVRGAYGLANMSGGTWEAEVETVRLRDVRWGDLVLPSLLAVTRREGAFEQMMSGGTVTPVVGAVAGNLLERLRVEWRHEQQRAWLDPVPGFAAPEVVCQVPLTLVAHQGEIWVAGTGDMLDADVQRYDRIRSIDGMALDAACFADAVDALRGTVGETKHLILRRGAQADERELEVEVAVIDLV